MTLLRQWVVVVGDGDCQWVAWPWANQPHADRDSLACQTSISPLAAYIPSLAACKADSMPTQSRLRRHATREKVRSSFQTQLTDSGTSSCQRPPLPWCQRYKVVHLLGIPWSHVIISSNSSPHWLVFLGGQIHRPEMLQGQGWRKTQGPTTTLMFPTW